MDARAIEAIDDDEWDVPEKLLAQGVPVYYSDNRCKKSSQMIERLPCGGENLIEVFEDGHYEILEKLS